MNSPEPLILEALSHDLPDDVRQLAVDFLSGERGIETECRASALLGAAVQRLTFDLCFVVRFFSGGYCSESAKQGSLIRLSQTLDSLKR